MPLVCANGDITVII